MEAVQIPRMETFARAVGIIFTCILAAVFYGILHDMVTAHICVEYFSVAHPMVVPTDSPVVLALVWGVLATWWVGLILGIPLAIAALAGSHPQVAVAQLLPRIGRLLMVMGATAMLAGIVGYVLNKSGAIFLVPPFADDIPKEHHAGFFFDAFAHMASYILGFVGGTVLVYKVWRSRPSE